MYSKNIDREEAMIILKNMLSNKSLIIHCVSVALVMEAYALKIKENRDKFFITGLLHDADYEKYPDKHPQIIVSKLKELGEGEISYAISCHYSKWGIKCISNLDKYLLACDELTGFIVACSKVRPNGIRGLNAKSIRKSLKKKSFAASVDRNEIMYGSTLIDVELDKHIEFIIKILIENATDLELKC